MKITKETKIFIEMSEEDLSNLDEILYQIIKKPGENIPEAIMNPAKRLKDIIEESY